MKTLTSKQALQYLDDIAHGRKMKFDAHVLAKIIEKDIEILGILKESPFILEVLFAQNFDTEHTRKYMFGTITNNDVEKVKEWIKDEE